MAEYFGALGSLVELGITSAESTKRPDRYGLQEDAAGGVRARLRSLTPRSWSVSAALFSDRELAAMEGFVLGEWGSGPWHWVSIAAQNGNLLTPAESLCLTSQAAPGVVAESGPMQCADGTWAGRSYSGAYTGSGWVSVWSDVPVLPGRPVTFSADVTGDGQAPPLLNIGFWDASGNALWSGPSAPGVVTTGATRVSVTATPPPGAASARVGIRSSVKRLTRPQVAWGDKGVPWTTGKGCRKAIPLNVGSDLRLSPGRGRTSFSDVQVTIQELT